MICPKCGEKNEDNAKFCTKCGAKLEEVKKEKTKEEISKEEQAKKDNKAVIIVLCIFGGLVLLGMIGYFALTFFIGMFTAKTVETVEKGIKEVGKEIEKNESKTGTSDQIFPEFSYVIPSELVPASYNSKTLGFFKSDSSNLCSLTIWNITYVSTNSTAESIMASHSSISNISELTPTNTRINGKDWTTYSTERYGTKYNEFGRFSSDGKNFYMIKYSDYKPNTGICNGYLNKFLKTVKSK